MNTTVTLALAGGVFGLSLAVWSQVKKFNRYRTKQKILKLENKRNEIEDRINEMLCHTEHGPGYRDTFDQLQASREKYNRDILQLRKQIGES